MPVHPGEVRLRVVTLAGIGPQSSSRPPGDAGTLGRGGRTIGYFVASLWARAVGTPVTYRMDSCMEISVGVVPITMPAAPSRLMASACVLSTMSAKPSPSGAGSFTPAACSMRARILPCDHGEHGWSSSNRWSMTLPLPTRRNTGAEYSLPTSDRPSRKSDVTKDRPVELFSEPTSVCPTGPAQVPTQQIMNLG